MKNKVTLQISLAPPDFPITKHLLVHQLNALIGQVDEVILTVDTKPSKGRFAEGWKEYKMLLDDFLKNMIQPKYHVKIISVDYSPTKMKDVSKFFFGTPDIPAKDFRGGPFYAYFFGLFSATNDLVLHLDSDMFLGGGSDIWVEEAIAIMNTDKQCIITSPLPGPPHPKKILIGQSNYTEIGEYTYAFEGMSTRIFMLDRRVFSKRKLSLSKPALKNQLKALIKGNPVFDLPEHLMSSFMREHNYKRVDLLGTAKGMWSLHPPYRTAGFYLELPNLISRVEKNELPSGQSGFYDISDTLFDWSEARLKLSKKKWII